MLKPLLRKSPLLISLILFLCTLMEVNAYAVDSSAQYYYGLKIGESIALENMLEQMGVCEPEDISCATLKGKGVELSGDGNIGYIVTGVDQGCAVITVSLTNSQAVAVNVNSARDVADESAEAGSVAQKCNSSFTVLGESSENTYVAGLSEAALAISESETYSGKNIRLSMSMSEAQVNEDIHSLNKEADRNRKTVGMLFDLELRLQTEEGQTQELNSSPSMLVLHIPLEEQLQGRDRYVIYRIHEGKVQTLTEGTYGERIVPNADRTALDVYLQNFSSYALTWEDIEPIALDDGTDIAFMMKLTAISLIGFLLVLIYISSILVKNRCVRSKKRR